MSYYRTCQECGANLDPGERCDCTNREGTEREEARKQRKAALDAANIDDGRVQQVLTGLVDASSINETEENCK